MSESLRKVIVFLQYNEWYLQDGFKQGNKGIFTSCFLLTLIIAHLCYIVCIVHTTLSSMSSVYILHVNL